MASLFDLEDSSDSEDPDFNYPGAEEPLSSEDDELVPWSDDDEKDREREKKSRGRQGRGSKSVLDSPEPAEESKPVSATVDEKKKADDVYKNFLDEVAAEMKESKHIESVSSCSESVSRSPVVLSSEKSACQSSSISSSEKLFEFAGETICVVDDTVKSVDSVDSASSSDSKIEKAATADVASAPPPVKRRGLEAVLGTIQNKKQKITVMQKSALDWKSFKKEENLGEELQRFNRGKGGFIERQRFLERSDVRSYEIERDMRLSKRPTQQKRDT